MQPELLLFAHHPSYSSGLVCLFVSFLVFLFFCLFVLFVQNPPTGFVQHIDHKEESPLTDDREYAQGVASEGLSPLLSKCKKKTCFAQHNTVKRNNKSTRQVQTDLLLSNMRRPLIHCISTYLWGKTMWICLQR